MGDIGSGLETLLTGTLNTGPDGAAFGSTNVVSGSTTNSIFEFLFTVAAVGNSSVISDFGGLGAENRGVILAVYYVLSDTPFGGTWTSSFISHHFGSISDNFDVLTCGSTTNVISAISMNVGGPYYVGDSCPNNYLEINSGGSLTNTDGYMGNASGASNNTALATGTGSLWKNTGYLYVGNNGASNQLIIANGGAVYNATGYVGFATSASNNSVLVTGAGSVWSNSLDLYIGNSGSGNRLTITNGGVVFNFNSAIGSCSSSNNVVVVTGVGSVWSNHQLGVGYCSLGGSNSLTIADGAVVYSLRTGLGLDGASANNTALVSGTGSVWNAANLTVGHGGAGNLLTITNGGAVYNLGGAVGSENSNNVAVVTGAGSVWSNSLELHVGTLSSSNRLTIANGGKVFSNTGTIGRDSIASNNVVVVTGPGSVWQIKDILSVGVTGSGNQLIITNGGAMFNNDGPIGSSSGSSSNTVTVGGNGALWSNLGNLTVGSSGSTNTLSIGTGGSVLASNAYVGFNSSSVGNRINITGGSLIATNGLGTGALDVRRGTLMLSSGTATVDQLVLTNGVNSVFTFNGGALNSKGTTVNNGSIVAVGDGASAATLHLVGGIHSFANNLRIRTSAFLTGCGTITGNVLVDAGGTVIADCGTTLNFVSGTFTNNGSMFATGGTVLKFYGPVVNNGLIDATGGNVQFFSTINDNGTILTPTNSWTDGTGKWETAANWSAGVAPTNTQAANLITNAGNKTVTIDATTSGSFPGTMTIRNLNISGFGSSTNTLALSNAGLATPLHVINRLNFGSNSAVVVNNSALHVDDRLAIGSPMGFGNQLIITNGGQVVSADALMGGLPGSANSVLVTGTNSVWMNTNNLVVLNSSEGIAITVANGGSLLATNVYIGHSGTANDNVVLVTDAGSTWTNTGTLFIGSGGTSGDKFVVSNGASAFSTNAVIGEFGNSDSAVVTGTNSLWSSTGTIRVGNGGTNHSLTVTDGGAVIVSNASHTAQVTVDGATLFLGDGTFHADNLVVTNSGAIQYTQTYQVENANVTIASGNVQAGSNFVVASTANSTATVAVVGGTLVATNGVLGIGNDGSTTNGVGVGTMTVSNGTLLASTILLGSSAGGQGEMTLADGGLVQSAGTNAVLICNDFGQTGGDLNWTNIGSAIYCGYAHPGAYALSNGTSSCQDLYIGYDNAGTMTIAGGAMSILSRLTVGHLGSPMSTGAVWMTGGQLTMLSLSAIIGNSGAGQMTISNGVVTAADVFIGNSSNPGTLTLAGGTLTLNNLVLPNPGSRFIFSGGWLNAQAVSNANGQIVTVGNGVAPPTLNLLGSISLFDKGLTISANATLRGFGTISGSVANFGLIMPGDSLLSFTGIVTNNGLIVTNSAIQFLGGLVNNGTVLDAAKDADGDGMNNLSEAVAGTNPTNSASAFHITAVTKVGNDVQVSWSTVGGKRYVVQASTASGGYTNNFTDLSSVISIPGTGESSTSYPDSGAAISNPARFYRVRLVP